MYLFVRFGPLYSALIIACLDMFGYNHTNISISFLRMFPDNVQRVRRHISPHENMRDESET